MLKCRVNLTDKVRDIPNRERAEADFVRRDLSGQRHGHICTTVEAAAKRNHAGASGMGAGDFHRVLHRFRTGGEERSFSLPAHRGKGVDFLRRVT